MSDSLLEVRTAHLNTTASRITAEAQALTDHLRNLYSEHLLAVLFYGSCLQHKGNELVDLYAIVSDYRQIWPKRRLLAQAARLLPPNVFFLQHELPNGELVRCKYAVLTLRDFEAGCARWFHSYVYGRFAQPVAIPYCQSQAVLSRLLSSLGTATDRLLAESLPLTTDPVNGNDLWKLALGLSYGTELRPEPAGRIEQLIGADPNYYENTARVWLATQPEIGARNRAHLWRARWWARSMWGKLLSVLRLLKALATFDGALDYAVYKVEKHTGEPIQIAESIRRRRLLFIPVLIFKLLRATI